MTLDCEGLRLRNGSFELTADFSVPQGASVAVMGPSGGGKSSLLAGLAGFLPAVAGRVCLNGAPLDGVPPGDRPMTLLFQEHNLFPHLTVAQNAGLGLRPDLKLSSEDKARRDAALDEVGLSGLGARYPSDLSGGQRSRAALARALLRDRPLLMLDEPFAALGPALRADMLDLVARIRAEQGATLLMVTHHPADARRIAPLTIFVDEGRAHAPVETEVLLADPPPALKRYLGEV
ncbi:thiamine ABC transporter ATP-binding protein [Oceanomicrobium pacificus]|uniref:thiamine ABC transporter ATP-binding protein n=1 Tax=Oceanomicrobium pacificus TaxID=2692916 RepID=UPI001F1DDBC9|nr:ATP-binding cassette domain-containing protein [Oceanomicrobium pacificus]